MLIGLHFPFNTSGLDIFEQERFKEALYIPASRRQSNVSAQSFFAVGDDLLTTENGKRVLFSGHIQNRSELMNDLGLRSSNDAQLYAASYLKWGDLVDVRVIGSFATIIIEPHSPFIRIAASPISAPPLHYFHDGHQFMVASRLQALFGTGRIQRVLNEAKIADSLFLNYRNSEEGWFEGVKRLLPGTRAHVTPDGISVSQYYNLMSIPDIRLKSDEEYVEYAEELFCKGANSMLEGFDRPAVSLSGGYDSQAVAAYVMRLRPNQKLQGYTSIPEAGWDGITHDARFGDERHQVEALAEMYPQLHPNWITSDGLSFDHFQREMFEFTLQCQRGVMNQFWLHEVFRRAKADGCDVILNGQMGNATFSYSGDHALSHWLATGKYTPLIKELLTGGSIASIPRRFIGGAVMPVIPRKLWEFITRTRYGTELDPFESWSPMNREFAAEMNVSERATAMGSDPLFRRQKNSREWRTYVLTTGIAENSDNWLAVQMIHGIQVRDPTSYRPLLEFCIGIPDDQYLRGGIRRWLAKRMLYGKVPHSVLHETRKGLQAADWHLRLLRQRDQLIDEIDWLMEDPGISKRLNLQRLRQAMIDLPEKTPKDYATIARLKLAVPRGLATARFIRYLDGRNF